MTVSLSGSEVARQIKKHFPDSVSETSGDAVLVKSESLFKVAEYLKNTAEFDFDYLSHITVRKMLFYLPGNFRT